MGAKAKILIIYTGGTIGMFTDPVTGSLRAFDFNEIEKLIPETKQLNIDVDTYSFENPIDSSNAKPEFWIKLIEVIEKSYYDYDGFVILHGTDTMSYTGSALSFMINNLTKPVILTGAQLPLGTIRTDGKENIITALEIAAAKKKDGNPRVPEVAIYFENKLFRANRTHKYNAEYFDAFESPNYPPLAEAGIKIHFNDKFIINREISGFTKFYKKIDKNIIVLKIFPGIKQEFLNQILNMKGLKGVVLETFGSGNAPTEEWFIDELKKAIENGIIIYNVTQCNAGKVDMGRYETSRMLKEIGVVSGYDITTEAAVTKLMFLLGQGLKQDEIAFFLEQNIAGELSRN